MSWTTPIADILVLLGLTLLADLLGGYVLRRLGYHADSPLGKHLLAQILGWVFLSCGTALLGFLGLLRTNVVWPLFLLPFLLLGRDFLSTLQEAFNGLKQWIHSFRSLPLWEKALWLIWLSLAGFNLIRSHVPPTLDDEVTYQLYPSKFYVETGKIQPPPVLPIAYFYPQSAQMIYTLLMLLRNDMAAKTAHFLFGLLLSMLVFWFMRRRAGPRSALLSAVIFYSMPITITLSGLAYVDLMVATWQVAALFVFWEWKEKLGRGIRDGTVLQLFCFLAGAAFAAKFTGIGTLGILALWGAILILQSKTQVLKRGLTLWGSLFGWAVALWLPWGIYNAYYTGNPFYPMKFLNFPFQPNFMDLATHAAPQTWSFSFLIHCARSFLAGNFPGPAGVYWGAGPLLGLIPLIFLLRLWTPNTRFLLTAGFLNLVILTWIFYGNGVVTFPGNWKYAMFSHALFSCAVGEMLNQWIRRENRWKNLAIQGLVLATILTTGLAQSAYVGLKRLPFQIGRDSRESYLMRMYPNEGYDMIRFVNQLSPNSKMLVFFDHGGGQPYYYLHPFVVTYPKKFGQWGWPAVRSYCRYKNVTHILFARYLYHPDPNGYYPDVRWLKEALDENELSPVYDNGKAVLYIIKTT